MINSAKVSQSAQEGRQAIELVKTRWKTSAEQWGSPLQPWMK
ncbi:MAG: hypothetical protein WA125_14160 [Desulfosporosinus sp.]